MATCKEADCDRAGFARGWCRKHYRLWYVAQLPICSVEGCEKQGSAKGLCSMHYHRWYKHGDVATVKTRWEGYVKGCDVLGCAEKHYGKGFCKAHYREHIGRHDQEWNDRRRANYQRRRARKRNVPTEHVPLELVYERDRGVCQICRDPMGVEVWPHPLSPSLDHVVPLASGGPHTLANVQLAHLGCNLQKGTAVAA